MAGITAALVKELRDMTGAGMMDAKKALTEANGDMDAAVDWLRTKGLSKAAKKADRVAAEGLVSIAVENGVGVAVEVNSETDFVAKNSDFQSMVKDITSAAFGVSDVEGLKAASVNGKAVADLITDNIAKIGENMSVRRLARIEGGNVAAYVHNAAVDGMGKIGVLVAIDGDNVDFARQVAMHIAAINPASLSEADLDPAIVEKERNVLTEQARESGKPENIIENMIKGRMKKFFSEVTLLNQSFVIDPDKTVAEAAKDAGVTITGFIRMEVGEGVEKKSEDFAAEVAATAKGG
ncbi:translation elongation factor Ts [Hyphobacterium sp. HN65]|uniref:Elongation factor Ts n=1 Tax=Hyphobacterium lacteum TaxID=3116575 RepID=A0ABU7LLY1_9PROT|nr:translation elongation factor Ts [Hyphobacterium sp. HN65]MEE2524892.1 translation elongation factor Ts [Hyphobacterium sp. HN65]